MKRKMLLLTVLVPLIMGCSSFSKVDYNTFHTKALEAASKVSNYTTAVLNGRHVFGGNEYLFDQITYTFKDDEIVSVSDDTYAGILGRSFVLYRAKDVNYLEGAKYSVGKNGFRINYSNSGDTIASSFDKYGHIVSEQYYTDTSINDYTVKWSK